MRFTSVRRIVAALFIGILASGVAQAADSPETVTGAKTVSADEVMKVLSTGAAVIDARVASEYAEGHIKGAIDVPYREKSEKAIGFDAGQDEFNLAKLPADKGSVVVIYCNGPECWKSYKASVTAVKGGYTNVLWYRAGFPDWKSKGLPAE